MTRLAALVLSVVFLGRACLGAGVIAVDPTRVLRANATDILGINVNYLRDDETLRPPGAASLGSALQTLGARWVRYPGGEKSDWHLFAAPPEFARPDPQTFGWYRQKRRSDVLDFDEYLAAIRPLHAEPYVVVGYDSKERTGIPFETYLAHAVAWVKYANVTRRAGVRYWEIGNENWHNGTATAEKMVTVVRAFSRAMKAVDPTIRIGTNFNRAAWAKTLLDGAGDDLDFLSCSSYFNSRAYEPYRDEGDKDLIPEARAAADLVAQSPHAGRIEVIAAEFGAMDFTPGVREQDKWEANDLGHALVVFDLAGQILAEPRMRAGMFWNTRWMDDASANRSFYALGPHNEITLAGRPLAILHEFLQPTMVAASSPPEVRTFASFNPATKRLVIFAINKTAHPRTVTITVGGDTRWRATAAHQLAGSGPTDPAPKWREIPPPAAGNIPLTAELPGTSLTVLDLSPAGD